MNPYSQLSLYFSTIRHLKKEQIIGQVKNRLKRVLRSYDKFIKKQKIPIYPGCSWKLDKLILPPGPQNNSQKEMQEGWFEFLNQRHNVGWPPNWDVIQTSKLWQYNLHYFEYLWALDFKASKILICDWIEKNKIRSGHVGWEPYPLSLRLINLCGVFFGKYLNETHRHKPFLNKLWSSIYLQAQWLTRNMETHILGNHLLENAVALTVAGRCFEGKVAQCWYERGLEVLKLQLKEQILSDGMHFELSPMYHCRIVYLLCLLYSIKDQQLQSLVQEPLIITVRTLRKLIHPDGGIALFSDSAHEIYNSPSSLIKHADTLLDSTGKSESENIPVAFHLEKSGYYGSKSNDGNYVICDMGAVGPDYLPAHGHADIFSFELSLKGHRIIVDSGVYDYEKSEERDYCRSTKAHNTIEIGGMDQCELWGIFRVGKRRKTFDVKWITKEAGLFRVSGKHGGYKMLPGKPIHYREFDWNSGKLIVTDEIHSTRSQNIISRLHFHPNCSIASIADDIVQLNTPAGIVKVTYKNGGKISTEKSFYCPQFGVKQENVCLKASYSGNETESGYIIELM